MSLPFTIQEYKWFQIGGNGGEKAAQIAPNGCQNESPELQNGAHNGSTSTGRTCASVGRCQNGAQSDQIGANGGEKANQIAPKVTSNEKMFESPVTIKTLEKKRYVVLSSFHTLSSRDRNAKRLKKTLYRAQFISHVILPRSQCRTAAAEGAKLSTMRRGRAQPCLNGVPDHS